MKGYRGAQRALPSPLGRARVERCIESSLDCVTVNVELRDGINIPLELRGLILPPGARPCTMGHCQPRPGTGLDDTAT